MKNKFNAHKITFRTFIILFAILTAYFTLILYMLYLQIFYSKKFKALATNNFCKIRIIYSPRGLILDRYNRELVNNRMKFRVILVNQRHGALKSVMGDIESNLNLPFNKLAFKVRQNYFPIIHIFNTMEEVNRWTGSQTTQDNIIIEEYWERHNIYKSLNHLMGYLRYDQLWEIPMKGLEKKYNHLLEGNRVKHKIYINTHRNVVGQEYDGKYKQGKNIITHIWLEAQEVAEKLMGHYKGGIVVMNGKGEILVHLSSPYLEVYENVNKKNNFFLNKILQERYPPGSIFKIISSLVLMDMSICEVKCTGGIKIGQRVFHCWKRTGHGMVRDIPSALAMSCNCFFFENVLKSNINQYLERFYFYLKIFGFGEKTQEELPEIKSPMHIDKKIIEVVMASIGQGKTVTTIMQNCNFITNIFTGYRVTPQFTQENKPQIFSKLPIEETKLQVIRKALLDNFKYGTCAHLNHPGILLCGKTSTSQVMSLDRKNYRKEHSLFIGGAPEKDLYISILVENMGFGSQYAGKIAGELLKFMVDQEKVK